MPRKYVKKNSYKKYSSTDFQLAIESIEINQCSIREASQKFSVPYTTLNLHVNGVVIHKQAGRPTKFSQEEEDNLEQAAILLQRWGVPLTIEEFLNISKQYAVSLNKIRLFSPDGPTYEWFYSFLHRHNNLVLKKSKPLEKKRAALTSQQVDDWFDLLNKVISENDLVHRPAQIFNADESGMSDNISYSKVIVHRNSTHAYRVQGGTGGKTYTSVLYCGSATGQILPPFVIYKAKRFYSEWGLGGPPDAGYDCSESGWMDQSLFHRWFQQIFLEQTKHLPRPILLIVDGHGSHFDVQTLKLAVEQHVIILCLPANSTHVLQPLDVVFFSPLKVKWKEILKEEYDRTRFQAIRKERFPSLLNELLTNNPIQMKTNLVKSFMATGIFPFNPNGIDRSKIIRTRANSNKYSSNSTVTPIHNTQSTITTTTSSATTTISSATTTTLLATTKSPRSNINHSSFTSSQQAIAVLNDILQQTQSNHSETEDSSNDEENNLQNGKNDNDDNEGEDEDDDNDDDYLPPKSILNQPSSRSSNKKQNTQSSQTNISPLPPPPSPPLPLPPSPSPSPPLPSPPLPSPPSPPPIITTTTTTTKHVQPSRSERNKKKRNKKFSDIIGFDASEDDDDDDLFLPTTKTHTKDVSLDSSGKRNSAPVSSVSVPSASIRALEDAIEAVFGTSSQMKNQTTKRTVLKRTEGQLITEKSVIEQLEERKSKQKPKRSHSKGDPSAVKKRKIDPKQKW